MGFKIAKLNLIDIIANLWILQAYCSKYPNLLDLIPSLTQPFLGIIWN